MSFLTVHRDSLEHKDKSKDSSKVLMAEESMCDVAADSVLTKNTMFNAMTLKSETDSFLNMALEVPNRESPVQLPEDHPS